MTRLSLAVEQIVFARNYTVRLLDSLPPEAWFWQPPNCPTHIAWQVGHLAMAEFRLGLERVRGEKPGDADLISESFLQLFGRESVPRADSQTYPSPSEIRTVFDRVHQQVLQELPHLDDRELDQPILKPHLLVKTKLWSLLWCAQHELLHAGQIGLLRRLRGQQPIW